MARLQRSVNWKSMHVDFVLLLLLIIGGAVSSQAQQAAVTCDAADRAALLEFKDGLSLQTGESTSYLTQFDSWVPASNCCTWFTVTCNSGGRVQDLGQLTFRGTVTTDGASALGRLDELESMVLWSFQFNQPIPKAWGQLRKLKTLSLNECQFLGTIPKEIGRLSSLESLNLSPPPGPLPDEVCNLTNIRYFGVGPGLTGNLPNCIDRWTKVQNIQLGYNNLTGLLPLALGKLSTLTSLYLNDNYFYGPIPSTIGGLKNLVNMNIQRNRLTGPLPKELGRLQNLKTLELTDNRIWGTIPPEVGNMSSLWLFDIASNYLHGGLPDSLGRMPELISIQLSNNNLYGTLPSNLGFTPKLFNLHLDFNRFWGRIPVSIFNNVSDIVLGHNYFSGPLPLDGNYNENDNLEVVSLPYNRLTGGVPFYLAARTQVDLSHNRLSISRAIGIPPTPSNERVRDLYLHHNNFSGPIPSWLFTGRSRLKELDLSFNQFSGTLPGSLFDLPRIQLLDLSSNRLSSLLPTFGNESRQYFFQSQTRATLNLSHNAITGGISAPFFNISSLDLSDNGLSGGLQGIDNVSGSVIFYLDLSNNHLTGSIPDSIGNLTNLQHLDLSDNELSGQVPASLAALPDLTYEDLSGNVNLTGV